MVGRLFLYFIIPTSFRKFWENVLRLLFCLVLSVGADGARVTHVKLTFPSGERDYTFIILCAHTHTRLYIIYTICMCIRRSWRTKSNLILFWRCFFFQYRLFIYSFPPIISIIPSGGWQRSRGKAYYRETVEWKKFRILLRATTTE